MSDRADIGPTRKAASSSAGVKSSVASSKRSYTPRKQPQQSRSKDTVERILNSAWTILETRGAKALTTRSVAAESGVNIASIYQFFPNKQAILHDLYKRRLDGVIETFDNMETPENLALGPWDWLQMAGSAFDKLGWTEPAQVELQNACRLDRELSRLNDRHLLILEQRMAQVLQRFLPDADAEDLRLLARFLYGIERLETQVQAGETEQGKATVRQWKHDIYRMLLGQIGAGPGAD